MKIVRRTRKEAFEHWLKALRSGEYKQSKEGALQDSSNRFCCLGVLCDLIAKDGGPQWELIELKSKFIFPSFMEYTGFLPKPVSKFMGLSKKYQSVLATMNDMNDIKTGDGFTFSQIANHIETRIMPKVVK